MVRRIHAGGSVRSARSRRSIGEVLWSGPMRRGVDAALADAQKARERFAKVIT